MTPFHGGCACGMVRYEVSALPLAFMLCHCRDCQYVSGGEPAAAVVVPRSAFTWIRGETSCFTTIAASGSAVTRRFCPRCGTPMLSELAADPRILAVKAGSMDDSSWLKPTAFLWTASAQPWAHLDPTIQAFEKQPPMD